MSKVKRVVNSNISLIMILAGVVGFAFVCYWFFKQDSGLSIFYLSGKKDLFFNENPRFLIWMSSIVIQPVIWFILLIPVTLIITKLTNELKPEKYIWLSYIAVLLLFGLFTGIVDITFEEYIKRPGRFESKDIKLYDMSHELRYFTIAGQVIGLYYLFVAVLVSKVSMKMVEEKRYEILCYRKLKSYMDTTINFTSIIFTLGIISAILLKRAINDEYIYSQEALISLGIQNSLLILIMYLPAHLALFYYGRKILENKFESAQGDKISELDILTKQNDLTKNLNLTLGIPQSIRTLLVILSPLLSSLVPELAKIFPK